MAARVYVLWLSVCMYVCGVRNLCVYDERKLVLENFCSKFIIYHLNNNMRVRDVFFCFVFLALPLVILFAVLTIWQSYKLLFINVCIYASVCVYIDLLQLFSYA